MTPSSSTAHAASLLFCHGGGFCKNVWSPIIKRLQASPLLQRAPSTEMLAFDFPYHGTQRNVSEPATVRFETPTSPRVFHPAMHWRDWSAAEVQRQVRLLRDRDDDRRVPVIGIGHSMGAAALWATEVKFPGTFSGLILFEPICNLDRHPQAAKSVDFLVSITLQRRHAWESFEDAEQDILTTKNFARWHPESLKGYISGAVVKVSPENNALDPSAKYALSCHPHIEASLYCGDPLRMTDEEMARVRCRTVFQYGARTQLFFPKFVQPVVEKVPSLYRLADPVPNTTHALVMEDPDTVTARIVEVLDELAPFSATPASRI